MHINKARLWLAPVCVALGAAALLPSSSFAAEGVELEHANVDVGNTASLQRGARNFVNYCMGCHSAKYVRYNRVAADLQLSEQQVIENLMFNGERPFDTMQNTMPVAEARAWFGNPPPDLSLIARSRTPDYIYTFLKSFYLDPSRPAGVNNHVLPGAAMPHVLWELQGFQKAVYEGETDGQGNVRKTFKGFEKATEGTMDAEEFDQFARDTVNFLSYIGEPVQLQRRNLGIRVLGFLLVFFLFAYFLKKEIWKGVK